MSPTKKPKTPSKPAAKTGDPDVLGGQLHRVVYTTSKLTAKAVARAKDYLARGADPAYQADDDNGTTVLFQLSFASNQEASLEILEAMLAKQPKLRAQPDKLGRWPLHVALWYGKHPAYWDKLVALGNPISPVDKRGLTPMFDAIKRSNQKGVMWLVDRGASLDGALAFAKAPKNYCGDEMIAFLGKLLAK